MATTRDATKGMALAQHFSKARRRFLISFALTMVLAVVSFVIYPSLTKIMQHPYCQVDPKHCNFLVTNPLDGLTLRVKISLFGGLLFSATFWLWHTWRFVTPGLKATERRYALPFVLGTHVFFFGGGVITPSSDPFSMFALMIPLVVFYFLAIGVGKLLTR